METTKCYGCQSEIGENDSVAFTLNGETLCESCEHSAWEYSNSVIVCDGDEITTYRWCADFGYRDTENWDETELQSVPEFKYHRTDGWRGYWDAVVGKGFTAIESGWATGRWSDVEHKHSFNDLCDAIQSGETYCPVKVVFAFGLTSNVFSTTATIVVRESDVDTFYGWVEEELGISKSELSLALC